MADKTIDKTILNITLLLRRAEFEDSCILAAGEPGYHTTTKEFKIGDGTTAWSALPIANKAQIEEILNGYKKKQTAKADPVANGSSLAFIDSITQDADGVITATKKNVDFTALTNHVNSDHVTKVSAGTDIVVTPTAGTGEVTVSHKTYGTGTIKDVNHDKVDDPSFITGIVVENGHVTNATVQNLKTVLQTDAFKELFISLLSDNVVIDGGTEADTVTLRIL